MAAGHFGTHLVRVTVANPNPSPSPSPNPNPDQATSAHTSLSALSERGVNSADVVLVPRSTSR